MCCLLPPFIALFIFWEVVFCLLRPSSVLLPPGKKRLYFKTNKICVKKESQRASECVYVCGSCNFSSFANIKRLVIFSHFDQLSWHLCGFRLFHYCVCVCERERERERERESVCVCVCV